VRLTGRIDKLERAEAELGPTPAEAAERAEMDAMIEAGIADMERKIAQGMTPAELESWAVGYYTEGMTGRRAELTADIVHEMIRLAGGASL